MSMDVHLGEGARPPVNAAWKAARHQRMSMDVHLGEGARPPVNAAWKAARHQRMNMDVHLGIHPAELPAGHVDDLAVDVVRPRGAEEEHRAGRLLGRGRAAERDDHRGHRAHLLGDAELDLLALALDRPALLLRGGEARLDEAEGDGVDVDLELAPLLRERLREAYHARLAGGVVHL